jgi:hypothetical protein
VKPVLLANALSMTSAVGVQAATYMTAPVALDTSSDILLIVVNTCTARASYVIVVKNAINGQTLRRKQGTLGVKRGAVLSFSWGMPQLVYQKITFNCLGTAKTKPLIVVTVRDLATKVPRFLGGDELLD